MDTLKTLSIRKHIPLINRLPESRLATQFDKANAGWVVFGEYLCPSQFEDIDFFVGYYNAVVDVWKVGRYEVA